MLAKTGEDADHPAAEVRIGIDTGKALAVNNGRRGHREPLFLGSPANHAAKRAGGGTRVGIYLTNEVRVAIGLSKVPSEDATALNKAEIEISQKKASLGATVDEIVKQWKKRPLLPLDWRPGAPKHLCLDSCKTQQTSLDRRPHLRCGESAGPFRLQAEMDSVE